MDEYLARVDEWRLACRAERLSRRTQDAYRAHALAFHAHVVTQGQPTTVVWITRPTVAKHELRSVSLSTCVTSWVCDSGAEQTHALLRTGHAVGG
jgi:hypothetical protein